MRASPGLICLLTALAGCTALPDPKRAPERDPAAQAAWPVLLPIDEILAGVPPLPASDPAAAVTARAAALKARAAALGQADPSG